MVRTAVRHSPGIVVLCGGPGVSIAHSFTPHPKRRTAPYSRFRRAVREPGHKHRSPPSTAWENGGSAVLQVGWAAEMSFVCGDQGCWLERHPTRNQNGGTTVLSISRADRRFA